MGHSMHAVGSKDFVFAWIGRPKRFSDIGKLGEMQSVGEKCQESDLRFPISDFEFRNRTSEGKECCCYGGLKCSNF